MPGFHRLIKLSLLPRRPVVLSRMSTIATPPGDAPNPTQRAQKEEKRLEKAAKLAAKNAKTVASTGDKKKEEEAPFVNTTPPERRKVRLCSICLKILQPCSDLSETMAAGYNPIAVESAWYDWWQKEGFFKPQFTADGKVKPEGVFIIPAPPPNVTGSLHIGHGLTTAIQDTLIRWNRMLAKTTLFAPGFDHAGISTQSVVEKRLYKKFLETVMDWKNDYQNRITRQLHRLGGSYDWDRAFLPWTRFKRNKAVIESFCRLHEDGTIYRANRLVHWCVKMNTTLSNLEVDQKQLTGRTMLTFGVLVSFGVSNRGFRALDEKIIVATTRPETMLGDTAIAVHPEDPRYKFAKHPFVDRRIPLLPTILLSIWSLEPEPVKITPAHDPNDYEVGVRHKLEFINILNDDGTFNANAGPTFKDAGLYIETKDNPMQIPICSKSGDVVEPVLKPQWWVNCKPLAEEAIKLVINPKQSENDWYRWLEGIQDWCISRQLWWGHRCPAYFRKEGANWATERAKAFAGDKKFVLEQDEDVLDTWFSSGLWPFSIMGWPDNTGWDIIFFWVARMVLLGIKLTGKVPFNESLGNVIDPIDVIQGNLDEKEIIKAIAGQKKDFRKGFPSVEPTLCDLRLRVFRRRCVFLTFFSGLHSHSYAGRDINLEIMRVEGYRKFCNKISMPRNESFVPEPSAKPTGNESLLNVAGAEVNTHLHGRNFMLATTAAYNFCYTSCEVMKPMTDEAAPIATRKSAQQTLYTCLDHGLRLLHPFMPFVTEELWQRLPRRPNDPTPSIMVAAFPVFVNNAYVFESADQQFNLVFSALKTGRSLAASYNLQSDIQRSALESQLSTIVALTKGCKSAQVVREVAGGTVITPTIAVHALVRGLVDLDKTIKLESQPDYEETVPANRKTLEAEISTVELSKSMFVKLNDPRRRMYM
ncbi:hypothetical protein B0H13DRAFT_2254165 [Mycena leptocephala]|nr:hypothetical protein B0H13DRAFT_2254165 [Mycena leptocephala]